MNETKSEVVCFLFSLYTMQRPVLDFPINSFGKLQAEFSNLLTTWDHKCILIKKLSEYLFV